MSNVQSISRRFQVRAFLPTLNNEHNLPLQGIGSVFVEVTASCIEDAYVAFYNSRPIQVTLERVDGAERALVVNPKTCSVLLVEEVIAPSGVAAADQDKPKVQTLTRVK
jgi:hypothetical protein